MKSDLIPLTAATATKTALTINPRATDKELAELGHTLAHIEGSRSWWMGDYGLELQSRKRKELKILKPTLSEEELDAGSRRYVGDRAEALGIDPANWHNCVSISRFYTPSVRTEISFSHHYIAIQAAGGTKADPKKAIAWLLRAEEQGWSIAQMRQQVKQALATAPAPPAQPEPNPFALLDDADQWAIQNKHTDLSPELAKTCLTRFAALIAFIDKLKTLAHEAE